jgi:hypothetical protein
VMGTAGMYAKKEENEDQANRTERRTERTALDAARLETTLGFISCRFFKAGLASGKTPRLGRVTPSGTHCYLGVSVVVGSGIVVDSAVTAGSGLDVASGVWSGSRFKPHRRGLHLNNLPNLTRSNLIWVEN